MNGTQLDLLGWREARRARGEAQRARALVLSALGLDVATVAGLAGCDGDTLHVPPTWSARVRGVAAYSGQAVVIPEGIDAPHVVLDAHPVPRRSLREGESAWRVVLVCATDDGAAVVRGVLRRGGRAWRLGRSLADARRRPTVATLPEPTAFLRKVAADVQSDLRRPGNAGASGAMYAQISKVVRNGCGPTNPAEPREGSTDHE